MIELLLIVHLHITALIALYTKCTVFILNTHTHSLRWLHTVQYVSSAHSTYSYFHSYLYKYIHTYIYTRYITMYIQLNVNLAANDYSL